MTSRSRFVRPGQPGGTRDRNRKEKREALLSTALRLFLQGGINETSIEDITQACSVAKGSFYRYFRDKNALVEALLEPLTSEVSQALRQCGKALEAARRNEALTPAYRTLAQRLTGVLLGRTEIVRLYLQESRGARVGARIQVVEVARTFSREAIAMTHQAHAHGLLRPVPPAVSALTVLGALERLMLALLDGEDLGNPLDIPEALITLILDGLRAPVRRGGTKRRSA